MIRIEVNDVSADGFEGQRCHVGSEKMGLTAGAHRDLAARAALGLFTPALQVSLWTRRLRAAKCAAKPQENCAERLVEAP